MSVEAKLRARARELLEKKEVAAVLGYRAGTRAEVAVPVLISEPGQAETLVLNGYCLQNLATYLPKLRRAGRIAVVATHATSRSIVNLLKERQVERDKLFVLGVPSGELRPVIVDEMFDEVPGLSAKSDDADSAFEARSPQERWDILSAELSRCIRCYACRAACPNCYCPTCFVDASRPRRVGRTNDLSDNVIFHLMRAMHMAGRCVECGACARACPMEIDLARINRKVSRIVRERFGAESGMSLDDPLPLAAFDTEDKQEFIR